MLTAHRLKLTTISANRAFAIFFDPRFQQRRSKIIFMKKPATRSRTSSAKKMALIETVDDYFARAPQPALNMLKQLRTAIRSVAPKGATEVISYRIPAFKYGRVALWYAAFSDHCSVFPTTSVMDKFKAELKEYRVSKGTLHFPLDKPLPTALIKKIAKARFAELQH